MAASDCVLALGAGYWLVLVGLFYSIFEIASEKLAGMLLQTVAFRAADVRPENLVFSDLC